MFNLGRPQTLTQLQKKTGNDTVIMTAIYGDKNNLLEPEFDIPGCDLVCFTDNPDLKGKRWHVVYWPPCFPEKPNLSAKVFKQVPHHYIPMYQKSLWIDGRIKIKSPKLKELVDSTLTDRPWAGFKHDERETVRAEADYCIEHGFDSAEVIEAQMGRYKSAGFPDGKLPFTIGGILLRRHMDLSVIKFGEAWWHEVLFGSVRDQLSFNFVRWQQNFEINILDFNFRNNDYWQVLKHKR